jgi:hypothetical protein
MEHILIKFKKCSKENTKYKKSFKKWSIHIQGLGPKHGHLKTLKKKI